MTRTKADTNSATTARAPARRAPTKETDGAQGQAVTPAIKALIATLVAQMVDPDGAGASVLGQNGSLLTPTQVSECLQIPLQTLYGWRSRDLGPRGLRVGRHVRYRVEDVAAWIAEQLADAQ